MANDCSFFNIPLLCVILQTKEVFCCILKPEDAYEKRRSVNPSSAKIADSTEINERPLEL